MGTDGHVQDVHVLNGCSTRSFGDGFGITDALTGRRSIRRCGNWIDRWPAGLIGNTRSCAGICAGQPTGSRVSRDAIRSCGRTGRWACGVAPWREPCERRRSSTVVRERRGEIPRRYSPCGGLRKPGGSGVERESPRPHVPGLHALLWEASERPELHRLAQNGQQADGGKAASVKSRVDTPQA